MRELAALFAPQWWSLKNRVLRSGWSAYIKSFLILVLVALFFFGGLEFLSGVLTKLQGLEGNVGTIVALKGLSLLLMLVFFLLIFSSLLAGINNFYLAKDLPLVLSSPVSWESMYYSKWIETSVKSSWMILFAILPVFVAFGVFFSASPLYYVILLPLLIMFVLIPSGIGIMLSILLMAFMPAKRAKNIFIFLGLLMLGILFLLFRFLKPERFANPEWFANLTIFLSEMKLPVSVFLPSMWVTEILSPFFNARGDLPFFYVLLLLFTALVCIVFGNWLFHALFYAGLVKAQQSSGRESVGSDVLSQGGIAGTIMNIPSLFFRGYRRALINKDIIMFFRNVGQSSQILLLFAIIVIYLFSIKALPVEWGTLVSMKLRYLISFFNIGLVAFVVTAVATRFVLPLVGDEGRPFWIIRVSPISMGSFLWSKFMMAFPPLLVLGLFLIILSNIFLGVQMWLMALGIVTCAVLAASITGLAIGIGARTATFSLEDTNKEQSGLQGTIFMLTAFMVITVTIALEIIPTSVLFLKEAAEVTLTMKNWGVIGAFFFLTISVNGTALWWAMRMGEKKLCSME